MNISAGYFGMVFFRYALLAVALMATPAYADSAVKKLTDQNVSQFIEKTTELTSGKDVDLNSVEILEYLERHLHEDSRFKTTIQFNIPGFPSRSQVMKLDKEEFIEKVKKGADSVSDYENEIEVKTVRISKDKTRASVETTGFETGVMPIGGEQIPIQGSSNCHQIIRLNDDGIIQMYSANCTTQMTFQEF